MPYMIAVSLEMSDEPISCIAPTDLIDVPQWMRMLYTDYTKATKIGVYTLYIHT